MATTVRALIMLSALVGLPAAWVYYGPLPPAAQRVVNQCVASVKDAVDWDKIDWSRLPKLDSLWTTSTTSAARSDSAPTRPATVAPRFDGSVQATPLAIQPRRAPAANPFAAPAERQSPAISLAAAPGPTPLHDQLEPLLAGLRALNVAEYALERWGAGGEMFRFRCTMPLAEGTALTQEFQAVADAPRTAVEEVVREVTAWHTARGAMVSSPRLASY